MNGLESKQLAAFRAVMETGGFDAAASRLAITQSAVSQRLKLLEERIGQPLLVRESPVRATAAGEKVLRHASQIGLMEDELLHSLGLELDSASTLKVGVNADSLASWFLDAIDPLMAAESFYLQLVVDDQARTHSLLKAGEVTACISDKATAYQGCKSVRLGEMRYLAVASREFIERYFPDGISPQAMARAPVLIFDEKDQLQNTFLLRHFGISLDRMSFHRIPSNESFGEFIARGFAWGMVPEMQLDGAAFRDRLFPIDGKRDLRVPLYWHYWNIRTESLAGITQSLCRYARDNLY